MTANNNKFPQDSYFFPAVGDSSRLIVGCRSEDYSASRIAHAVEDCNAHLLNLNITSMSGSADDDVAGYPVLVDLRISHRNPGRVTRSLERYGYTVLSAHGDDEAAEAPSNIDSLFRYLEI